MKVVLLALSGDAAQAHDKLALYYPGATIQTLTRDQIAENNLGRRLRVLRAMRPDVFAIATERLSWQRGQNLFMLFGALAGAREVLLIDAHGGMVKKSRTSLLVGVPARLGKEAVISASVFAQARAELVKLERTVIRSENVREPGPIKKTPKIVYLRSTPGPGTQAGGAASHIKGVIGALIESGAELEVISNDSIAGLEASKVPLTVIPPRPFGGTRALFDIHSNLDFTRAALPVIEKANPDLIYQRYARFGWTGVVASLQTRRPLFLEYNGSEVWVARHWDHVGRLDLLARYELLNLRAAARIFVVSEVERRNLERSGIHPAKIIVNPNGVDIQLFRPGVGGQDVRRKLQISDRDVVVGFVGTFGPWHGVLALADAIKSLPQDAPVRFILIGTGGLYTEVENLLSVERATGKVIFTGAVKHERVPALLDACDILVAPHVPLADESEFFGSPTKLFEYMAMGKAIVASRLGQIADVLTHDKTALLVEPGDPSELAASILKLVRSPEQRAQLGKNARDAAERAYTWKHNAKRVLDAYAAFIS